MALAKPVSGNKLVKKPEETVQLAREEYTKSLQYLGALLGDSKLTPVVASMVHDTISDFDKELGKFDDLARMRVVDFVTKQGHKISDAGSMELDLGNGMVQPLLIQRSGRDPKKVEALLRAKNMSPDTHMDIEVKYKFSEGKAAIMVAQGLITQAELDTCNYEVTYRVNKSKPAKDE